MTRGITLSLTYGLGLESLNSLDVCANIVSDGLEVFEKLLSLINDSLVLQDGTVVSEVDGCRLSSECALNTLGIHVPLAEGLEGGNGLCSLCGQYKLVDRVLNILCTLSETKGRVDLGEVLTKHLLSLPPHHTPTVMSFRKKTYDRRNSCF